MSLNSLRRRPCANGGRSSATRSSTGFRKRRRRLQSDGQVGTRRTIARLLRSLMKRAPVSFRRSTAMLRLSAVHRPSRRSPPRRRDRLALPRRRDLPAGDLLVLRRDDRRRLHEVRADRRAAGHRRRGCKRGERRIGADRRRAPVRSVGSASRRSGPKISPPRTSRRHQRG